MVFSVVVAIYNRSKELHELLESFTHQTQKNFEIIIVDDGSEEDLKQVYDEFSSRLALKYLYKENSGPGKSRNEGALLAEGEYLLFVDSDCLVPKDYIENINNSLQKFPVDAFGGSDMAGKDFNTLQKAISYSMTSPLTTGGIRGSKKSVTKFQPRSFNMGVKKSVFEEVGGFSDLRIGEDPDLSMRIWKAEYITAFFPDVKVFHKRRNTIKSFGKQVYNFGIARPILDQRNPDFKKWVFAFPTIFAIGFTSSLKLFLVGFIGLKKDPAFAVLFIPIVIYLLYFLAVFIDSSIKNKSIKVGLLSVYTTAVQLVRYGFGYLYSWIALNILKKSAKKQFPGHFYN